MASNTPVPDTIGRFRIDARLGAGGMGEVYKGFDPALKRSVAVKTVRPGLGGQEYVERLYREAQACAALQHPNIVTIYEVGEFDGGVFIAMEFLKGHNLATVVEAGALSLTQRIGVLLQVLDALAHAHGEQVVHRDIKPSNVHLLPDGSIKLLDFGLARVESAETITVSGSVMGTPHYASPEQLRAERVDARSDLFSTGAMAYELFEGRRPFEGDTISAVLIKVLTEPPAPVAGEWGRRFPALEAFVQRAVAKSPAYRYQSAREMRAALASVSTTERERLAEYDAAHPARPLPETTAVSADSNAPTLKRDGGTAGVDAATDVSAATRVAAPQRATRIAAAGESAVQTRVGPPVADAAPSPAETPTRGSALRYVAAAAAVLVLGAVGYRQYVVVPSQVEQADAAAEPASVPLVSDSTPASAPAAPAAPAPSAGAPSVPAAPASTAAPRATVAAPAGAAPAAATSDAGRAAPAVSSAASTGVGQALRLFGDAAGKNAGLKWRVVRKLDSGEEVDVDPDQTFHSGDRVRLVFEGNIDGYLYVAHQGSSKKWTLLFPGETINGGSNSLARGVMLEVPNNGWLRFDDTPGTEELFVVLSRERLADLPGFQGRVRRSDSNLPTKAVDDLRLRLASRDLVFEKDPAPPKGISQPGKALAQYVVNRDELAKAVSATITLKHAQ